VDYAAEQAFLTPARPVEVVHARDGQFARSATLESHNQRSAGGQSRAARQGRASASRGAALLTASPRAATWVVAGGRTQNRAQWLLLAGALRRRTGNPQRTRPATFGASDSPGQKGRCRRVTRAFSRSSAPLRVGPLPHTNGRSHGFTPDHPRRADIRGVSNTPAARHGSTPMKRQSTCDVPSHGFGS